MGSKNVARFVCFVFLMTLTACSSNPHKAEKVDTSIEKPTKLSGDDTIGVKDGNLVVQRKVNMAEELRALQYEVYELEDRTYGNEKLHSRGLYGVLRECRAEVADKANGGSGKVLWTEPIDRVTDKEEEMKIGFDEKDKLVGVSEEYLKDRIARFKEYRTILRNRRNDLETKIEVCEAELKAKKFDSQKTSHNSKPVE